jgi:GST-like protein
MLDDTNYVPPKVWQWNKDAKQAFNTNRPTAGATHDEPLPKGVHPFQLYSLATPKTV